ncbi:MAG: sulfotransferase domain-containing protein [Bacteroidota bacterium]
MKATPVDFFVVGVARGGTTSLYNYLLQHPEVFLPSVKECNYFSKVASLDKEVYLEPEPGKEYHMKIIQSERIYNGLFFGAKANQKKGEVSPSYMWDKLTAQRIYDYNKEAKLIVTLRNPIERAYSHYLMHYHTGYDKSSSFEESLSSEKNSIWGGGNMYLEMGLYYSQLKAYFDVFSRNRIKVIITEDWTQDSAQSMNDIFNFLGVSSLDGDLSRETFNASKQVKNKGLLDVLRSEKVKKSITKIIPEKTREKIKEQLFYKEAPKQELDSKTYNRLKDYFKEDVKQTGTLIGMDLSKKWNLG